MIPSWFIGSPVTLWIMKRHSNTPAIFAMVIVAFLFALAPVFHAVCVAAVGHPSTSTMTHVMADGTVMDMSTAVAPVVMNMEMTAPSASPATISFSNGHEANVLGSIMITAGLTLLTFLGLRYCKQALARGQLVGVFASLRHIPSEQGRSRARPPTEVDLTTLCISRT